MTITFTLGLQKNLCKQIIDLGQKLLESEDKIAQLEIDKARHLHALHNRNTGKFI